MINQQQFISVILPFVDEEDRLKVSIQSILNQTYTDFELLLIANNAKSGSLEIATQLEQADDRVKLIYEQQQGIAHALNTGLAHAQGKWIARMDADDEALSQRFEKQVEVLQNMPEISVISAQTSFASDLDSAEGYRLFTEWQNEIIAPSDHFLSRFVESPLAHPTVMFHSELIDKYGNYHTGALPEDYELWLRWMDEEVKFYKIPEPLLIWNDHASRLSRNNENYAKEAFFTLKIDYLARWIKANVADSKQIVVCGASKIGRKRAALLETYGVKVDAFTDVKFRANQQIRFIPIQEIQHPESYFLINFIGKRGVGTSIKEHFTKLGFVEGKDFILAA